VQVPYLISQLSLIPQLNHIDNGGASRLHEYKQTISRGGKLLGVKLIKLVKGLNDSLMKASRTVPWNVNNGGTLEYK
jgi:hypothetical protein